MEWQTARQHPNSVRMRYRWFTVSNRPVSSLLPPHLLGFQGQKIKVLTLGMRYSPQVLAGQVCNLHSQKRHRFQSAPWMHHLLFFLSLFPSPRLLTVLFQPNLLTDYSQVCVQVSASSGYKSPGEKALTTMLEAAWGARTRVRNITQVCIGPLFFFKDVNIPH